MLAYGAQARGRTRLRLRDLQTGEERWLRFPLQRNGLESNATRDVLPDYAFAPDGRDIIVAYDGKIHRIDVGQWRTGNSGHLFRRHRVVSNAGNRSHV
jgi:hypothetical protein